MEKDKATVTINESVTGGDSNFQNWTQKQMLILGSTLFHRSLFAEEHLLESWASFSGFCSPYLYVFREQKIFKTHLKMFSRMPLLHDWSALTNTKKLLILLVTYSVAQSSPGKF